VDGTALAPAAGAAGVPLLVPTDGRLTGDAPSIAVVQLQRGSPATLAYVGPDAPNARGVTLTGLVPGTTYAFKVAALNAIGAGVPSAASPTVVTRQGASAAFTSAAGSALVLGVAGVEHEQVAVTIAGRHRL